MRLYLLVVLICFLLPVFSQIQVKDSTINTSPKKINYDTTCINKFGNNIMSVEPWIAAPTFEFRFEPLDDSLATKSSFYEPYLRDVTGIDINYRAVSLSIGFKGPIVPEDEKVYGKTKYSILKLRLNTSPFILEFYHNVFKGFSDANTQSYDTLKSIEEPFVKRADLSMRYSKAKAFYIFNHKQFSYGAAYSFTEQQKKSRATLFAVGHIYRLRANADSAIFNRGQEGFFGSYQNLKSFIVYSVGIGPGFAGTFVHKKWFTSFGLYLMADLQHHNTKDTKEQQISTGWRPTVLGDAFFSIGYNADRFYAGIVARGDKTMISLPGMDASTTYYSTVLSIGFRFKAPKFIGKLYDNSPLKYF